MSDINNSINNLVNIATDLIKKFETLAPNLWNCFIKQKIVEGWFNLGFSLVIIVLLIFFLRFAKKFFYQNGEFDDPSEGIFALLSMIAIGTCIWFICSFLYFGVSYLISPEYFVIKDFIKPSN